MSDWLKRAVDKARKGVVDETFEQDLQSLRDAAQTPVETPGRTLGDAAKDVGIAGLKGAIALPEAAVGIADLFTGGHAGKSLEQVGFRPAEAKQILEDQYSPAQKAAKREFSEAEGIVGKTKAALTNPSIIGEATIESLPLMLGGGGIARGLSAVPKLAGSVGARAAIGEGAVGAGAAAESIRQETEDGLLSPGQSALAAASGVGTAAFGYLGARIGKYLGLEDIDVLAAGGRGATRETQKGTVRRVLEGAAQEGLLEELPQSLQEQVFQNLALGRDITEGLDEAAVLGTLAGAVMGGGANVLNRQGQEQTQAPPQIGAVPESTALIPSPAGPLSRAVNKIEVLEPQVMPRERQLRLPSIFDGAIEEAEIIPEAALPPGTGQINLGGAFPLGSPGAYDPAGSREDVQAPGGYLPPDPVSESISRKLESLATPQETATLPDGSEIPERRSDAETRKRVLEMTPEEMARTLLTSSVANLPNRRAYEEAEKKPAQAFVDADSLKWINDELGHEAGDDLLRAIGEAFAVEGAEAYHVSGDEFLAQGDSEEALTETLSRVQKRLDEAIIEATLPDGSVLTKKGLGISYGLGKDLTEAESRLREHKQQRETEGQRAARGEEPPGVLRKPAQGQPNQGEAAEEVAPETATLEEMTREAARWRGAAKNRAAQLEGDKKAQLALSRQTTKGDLDAYLMRRFGIDEATARDVSNELTRQNIPDDTTAQPQEYAEEPWSGQDAGVATKQKATSERLRILAGEYEYEPFLEVVKERFTPESVIEAMGTNSKLRDIYDRHQPPKNPFALISDEERSESATGTVSQPDLILTTKGTPFSNKGAAGMALKARRLTETHEVVETEGGFALSPKGTPGGTPQTKATENAPDPFAEPDLTREAAAADARSIRDAVANPLVIDGHKKKATVSDNSVIGRWYLDNGISKSEAVTALEKYAEGKSLTPNQQAAVDLWKEDLDRRLSSAGITGDAFTEESYGPLSEETEKRIYEAYQSAKAVDEDAADAIMEKDISDGEVLRGLLAITERDNGQSRPERAQEDQAGQENRVRPEEETGGIPAQKVGEDGKLFATPPTFGKGEKKPNATLDDLALYSEPLERADADKQTDLFDTESKAAPLNIGDTFEYDGFTFELDDVSGGKVEVSDVDSGAVSTWRDVATFTAETGQTINLPAKQAPEGMSLQEAQNLLIELRTQAENDGRVTDARLLDKIAQVEKLVKELEAEGSKPEGIDAELAELSLDELSAMFDEVAEKAPQTPAEMRTAVYDALEKAGDTYLTADQIESATGLSRRDTIDSVSELVHRYLVTRRGDERTGMSWKAVQKEAKPKAPKKKTPLEKLRADLETKGAGRIGEADVSIQQGEVGGYSVRIVQGGIRTEYGGDPRGGGYSREEAIGRAVKEAGYYAPRPAPKKRPPTLEKARDSRDAKKIAAEAAKAGVKGVDEAMKGLVELFGGSALKSFPAGLDPDTYAKAKPHFAKALDEFRAAGKGVKEFLSFIIENFSAKVKPYLMHFLDEVKNGDTIKSGQVQTKGEGNDRIEEAGQGQPVRDEREGAAGAGNRTPGAVESEAAQGPDGVETTASGDAQGGRKGAQGNKRADGGRVPKARGGRGRAARVHSDQAGDRSGREDRAGRNLEQIPAVNYRIPADFELGRGETAKYNDNVSAVRILKTLQRERRPATAQEQAALSRYVGWGGLANAFRRPDGSIAKGWEAKVAEIESLLSETELETARNSTQFAHYTSKEVVDGLWKIVQRLGFKGGNALEPAMGTGNFLGMAPEIPIHFTGVEYDPLTAGVAAALYPRSNVIKSGFEKVPLPPNYFDLVIGNPPFSQNKLVFKYTPDLNRFSMHNQFMLAGIEALKPGGIQAFVVSRYFMDAKSAAARQKIAEQAELVAAFRLPDTAFKANAGTEVVTDIIVLQKRAVAQDNEVEKRAVGGSVMPPIAPPRWTETAEIADPLGGDPITVNAYFADNPKNILGTLDRSGSMAHGNDVTVHLDGSLTDALEARIQTLPQNIAVETSAQERSQRAFEELQTSIGIALRGGEVGGVILTEEGLSQIYEKEAEGGGTLLAERILTEDSPWHNSLQQNKEGQWYEIVDKLDEKGKPVKAVIGGKTTTRNEKEEKVYQSESEIPATKKLGALGYERLKGAVQILDSLVTQIDLENTQGSSDKAIEQNRKTLRRQYEAFVSAHGHMNSAKVAAIIDALPSGALLRSLEAKYKPPVTAARAKTLGVKPRDAQVTPADILRQRIVYPYEAPTTAESANDALAVVLSETGGVDLARIAELTGQSEAQVIDELHTAPETPVIFKDPETGAWETADEYLGGNVVRKLEAAKAAEAEKNVAALEKVQPEPWSADKVTAILGATWIPGEIYADFVRHLTGADASVLFSRLTNTFAVRGQSDTTAAQAWNTPGRRITDLLGNILNSQAIKITYRDDKGTTRVDHAATQAANDMAETVKEEFDEWVFKDAERRRTLVDLFNKKFNVRVTKQRNGAHLTFPGKVPDSIISLRRHQVNGIWRGIVDRFVLYDHAVGAGKTFTAIARAMERRRMGLSKKPMMVVPNHILEQVAKDVYALYPGAKILAAGTKDLAKDKRKRLFARIATGDWDLVIVPHSSFQFIGISPATEERYLQEELSAAIEAVKEAEEEAAGEGGFRKPLTVKEAERLRDNIQARLDKVRDKSRTRDNLLTFEQMGIDDLTVDESHEFKNLFYHSRLNVRGMNPKAGSGKAYDLWSKVRVLRDSKNGSVAFMTGTPISNSAVELYGIMRYLAADNLEEMGLDHFDAWRTQFSTVTTAFEPKDSGRGLKEVNRIGRDWSNMRSLMDLYYSFADAVSNEDIKKWYKEDNDGAEFPIPKVKGGGRQSINVEPSERQEAIIKQIVAGFEALPDMKDVDERNAERLRLMDRARKVSLDARAVNPFIPDNGAGGKLERVAGEVKRIYDAWHKDKGTQIVFLDRSVPKTKGDAAKIAKYDALVEKLEQAEESGNEADARKAGDELEKYDPNEMAELKAAQVGGWNAYDEIRKNLIASGIPAEEIKFVQEAATDDQKKALFEEVNSGKVRVLIGSTPRMGAGTNVQERLVGLHHVDVTWKPSDIEQREGRIIRQGNHLMKKYGDKFEVEIIAYTTNKTVDAKLWSLNATKLKMINGLRHYTGDFNLEFDDSDSVGMAEIAAIASGEPLQLERVQLTSEIDKLNRQKNAHRRRLWGMQDELEGYRRAIKNEGIIDTLEKYAGIHAQIEERAAKRTVTVEGETFNHENLHRAKDAVSDAYLRQNSIDTKKFSVTVDGKKYTSKGAAQDAVQGILGDAVAFEAVFDGETFRSRTALDKALAKRITETVDAEMRGQEMSDTEIGSVFFGELAVKITAQVSGGGREGQSLEVFAEAKDGGVWIVQNNAVGPFGINGVNIPDVVRGLSSGTARQVKDIAGAVESARIRAAKAKEFIPKLEELVKAPFPKEEELSQKEQRLEEVEAELSASADPAAKTDIVASRSSRSKGTPLEDLKKTLDPIVAELAAPVQIVGSQKDLPGHIRDFIASSTGEGAIEGVFDPRIKSLYLLADQIESAERGRFVLFHELGHFGFDALGEEGKDLLNRIYLSKVRESQRIGKQYGFDLTTAKGRRQAAGEVIANEFAKREGADAKLIERVIAAVRKWMRRVGFDLALSDAEISVLVGRMAKALREPAAQPHSFSMDGGYQPWRGRPEFESQFERGPAGQALDERPRYTFADMDTLEEFNEGLEFTDVANGFEIRHRDGLELSAREEDGDLRPYVETDGYEGGEGVGTKLYLSGLLLARDRGQAWRSDSIMATKVQNTYERLTDLGVPFVWDGSTYSISAESLRKTDMLGVVRKWMDKHRPSFSRAAVNTADPQAIKEAVSEGVEKAKAWQSERLDYLRMKFQDKFLPLKRLQQKLQKRGWQKTEDADAYLTEELSHGKIEDALEKFQESHVTPLLDELKASSVTFEEMEEYLYARHAAERNAYIQEINPEFEEGGSGMTDEEAEAVMARLASKRGELEKLAKKVDAITARQREIIREAGLETDETVEAWERFEHYVPLKGKPADMEDGFGRSIGRGANVRGSGTKNALGRRSKAENILANLIAQTSDSIIRAEKAEIGKAFLQMAEENPDPSLWTVHAKSDGNWPTRRALVGGEVRDLPDHLWHMAPNILAVTRDGQIHYVEIKDQDLARVMGNLNPAASSKTVQVMGWFTRKLAQVNTSLNPEFIVTNFERDLQTAMVNLAGEKSGKAAKDVLKGVPGAMRGIRNALRGDGKHEMATWYNRFKAAGGKVGFMDLAGVDAIQKEIEREVATAQKHPATQKVGRYFQNVGRFVNNYNTVVENAVRLSAFRQAVESGATESQAASLAKNLTVNFNRKGELGPAMNAAYMFFNAGVQGSARLVSALTHKRTRKIAMGIVGTGILMAELSRLAGGDDDDGEARWDKLDDFTKETNFLLMREDGSLMKVKLPYGYNVFVALGYALDDAARYALSGGKEGKSPAKAMAFVTKAAVSAFNPLGGEGSWLQTVSPTITDPFVQITENKNFFGAPVMPEQNPWGPPKPDSQRYFSSVRPLTRAMAEKLNRFTGGTEFEPGMVDVSPETLDHFWDFVLGGLGRFIADTPNIARKAAGQEVPLRRVPFARQVMAEPNTWADSQRFYDNLDTIEKGHRTMQAMREGGDTRGAFGYLGEHPEIRLRRAARAVQRQASTLSARRRALEEGPERKKVEERLRELYTSFNKRMREL